MARWSGELNPDELPRLAASYPDGCNVHAAAGTIFLDDRASTLIMRIFWPSREQCIIFNLGGSFLAFAARE